MKKKILIIFVVVFVLFVFKNLFSPEAYKFSALEIDRNITRQHYLFKNLGRLYSNRLGLIYFNNIYPKFFKFEYNFFTNLSAVLVYLPLYTFFVYKGFREFNEK